MLFTSSMSCMCSIPRWIQKNGDHTANNTSCCNARVYLLVYTKVWNCCLQTTLNGHLFMMGGCKNPSVEILHHIKKRTIFLLQKEGQIKLYLFPLLKLLGSISISIYILYFQSPLAFYLVMQVVHTTSTNTCNYVFIQAIHINKLHPSLTYI